MMYFEYLLPLRDESDPDGYTYLSIRRSFCFASMEGKPEAALQSFAIIDFCLVMNYARLNL
jgi:hypothetical protein